MPNSKRDQATRGWIRVTRAARGTCATHRFEEQCHLLGDTFTSSYLSWSREWTNDLREIQSLTICSAWRVFGPVNCLTWEDSASATNLNLRPQQLSPKKCTSTGRWTLSAVAFGFCLLQSDENIQLLACRRQCGDWPVGAKSIQSAGKAELNLRCGEEYPLPLSRWHFFES